MDSVVEVEFKELCRICANPKQQNQGLMISIFEKDGVKIELLEKIKRYLPINVSKDDGFPETVCISCTSKLNVCHQLVETCMEADARLQALKQQLDIETAKLTCYSPEPNYDDLHSPKEVSSDDEDDQCKSKAKKESGKRNVDKEGNPNSTSSRTLYEAGDSQVAVILAEKDEKPNTKPNLSIVLVNVPKEDPTDATVMEKVEDSLKLFRERCNRHAYDNSLQEGSKFLPCTLNKTSYACFTCELRFVEKDDMVIHFERNHPNQVYKCVECAELLCGNKDMVAKHQALHEQQTCELDKDELLSKMTSPIYDFISTFKVVEQGFKVILLGEYDPNLKRLATITAQTNKFISLIKRSKKVKPDMLDKVIKLIKEYFGSGNIAHRRIPAKDKFAPVNCNICNKFIKNQFYLAQHKYRYHSPSNVRLKWRGNCVHCERLRVPNSELDSHIERFHSMGRLLLCVICDEEYNKTGQEQPHMKLNTPFFCTFKKCTKMFKTEEAVAIHVKKVHEPNPVLCNYCGKTYKNKNALSCHIKDMHVESELSFICDICGKQFKKKKHLMAHNRTMHSKDRTVMVRCDDCNKLISKVQIASHRSQHKQSSVKVPCKYCGKGYSKLTIRYHEMRHEGIRSTKCPVCNAYSKTPEALKLHMKRHKEGEPLTLPPYLQSVTCDICNKVMERYTLKAHLNRHLKFKTFECEVCHMSFTSKGYLKMHKSKKHDFEYLKTLVCQICNKQQSNKILLRDHLAKHNNIRNHQCSLCNKQYFSFNGMYKHMQITHNVKYHMNTGNKARNTVEVLV